MVRNLLVTFEHKVNLIWGPHDGIFLSFSGELEAQQLASSKNLSFFWEEAAAAGLQVHMKMTKKLHHVDPILDTRIGFFVMA